MAFDLTFSMKVFAALFAIMNPIANIPVFLSLTEGAADGVRRKVALTAAIGVTVGCIVSAVAGGAILHVFGLTVDDFRLAGGLLVLLIALSMLHGAPSRQHSPGDDEGADPAAAESVAIYPLTIPLLVGPGTIATMIVLGHTAFSTGQAFAFALGNRRVSRVAGRVAAVGTADRPLPVAARDGGDATADGHDSRGDRDADDRRDPEGRVRAAALSAAPLEPAA